MNLRKKLAKLIGGDDIYHRGYLEGYDDGIRDAADRIRWLSNDLLQHVKGDEHGG